MASFMGNGGGKVLQSNGIKLANGGDLQRSKEMRQRLTIILLCLSWYVVSSTNNVIGKMVFNQFPFPTTVTMVQLLSITVYSGPFFRLLGIRPRAEIPRRYYMRLIVPLAIGKFLASVCSHISIWKVPVSYAHTGEAIPVPYDLSIFTLPYDDWVENKIPWRSQRPSYKKKRGQIESGGGGGGRIVWAK